MFALLGPTLRLLETGDTTAATIDYSLSQLLTDAGSIVTWLAGQAVTLFNIVTSSPVAIAIIACALVGTAVVFVRKLMRS